jgi:hypothetical protein
MPALEHPALPDRTTFEAVIHNSGDGAPGIDGIPYAVYRLAPAATAQLLLDFLFDFCNCASATDLPEAMLAWIPKADVGPSADNWRPLGLPNTFLRLLAAGIYYHMANGVPGLLQPAQALLATFREPQSNYMDVQTALDKASRAQAKLMFVLVADFIKAFEKVKPLLIMAVLRARRAPNWLVQYGNYVLFGRRVVPKVAGKILPPLRVCIGVDMGSAMSCLFFCLAVDPLLHALQQLPHIQGVRAYMDDNQMWAKSLATIEAAQTTYRAFASTGLDTKNHVCCAFQPASPRRTEHCPSLPGHAGWRDAAKAALLRFPWTRSFCPAGDALRLGRQQLRRLALGIPTRALARLVALPCKCKSKSALVPSRRVLGWPGLWPG